MITFLNIAFIKYTPPLGYFQLGSLYVLFIVLSSDLSLTHRRGMWEDVPLCKPITPQQSLLNTKSLINAIKVVLHWIANNPQSLIPVIEISFISR